MTLPAIRWGVTYGVVLATARALGEFGAVSVVAGNVSGSGGTQTLPLFVKDQFDNFNLAGAYAAALVLALIAIAVLFSMSFLQKRSARSVDADEERPRSARPGRVRPTAHPKGGLRWPSLSRT